MFKIYYITSFALEKEIIVFEILYTMRNYDKLFSSYIENDLFLLQIMSNSARFLFISSSN